MSLCIMIGNGEFLLDDEHSLCQESVSTEKMGSKRGDMWLTGQTTENHNVDCIYGQIGGSTCRVLEIDDDNLAKYRQHLALSIIRLTKSFHTFHTLSKVI